MGTCIEKSVANNDTKELGFNCLETLPEEMWRELMKKLWLDYNTLFNCRGVSPELKFVAEEELAYRAALSFKVGKCYTQGERLIRRGDYRRSDHRLFVTLTRGTHITKLEDVEKFTESKDIVGRHFPNGCVLFYPDIDLTNHLAFYKSLESLVNTFPDDISTLVYQPHWILDTADLLMHLLLIFKLKNLKRLFVYYCHERRHPQKFDLGALNRLLQSGLTKIPDINRLRNLHLREYPPNNDKLPLITALKNFLPDWNDLEYLNFNWSCSIDMGEIFEQMKEHPLPRKLKTLKLQDPSLQLLEYCCVDSFGKKGQHPAKYSPSPRYKDIQIHYNKGANTFTTQLQEYSKEESKVIHLFNTLDVNQTDLEILTLDLYLPPDFLPHPGPLPLNFSVQFTNLKEIQLNYIILLRWESLLEVLNEKLPNVERIRVASSYECMKIQNESNVKVVGVYHSVCNLWNVFPSLKMIHVVYYQWILVKGGKVPEKVMRAAKQL